MIYCKYCQVVIVLFNDRDGGVSSRFFFVFVFFYIFFALEGVWWWDLSHTQWCSETTLVVHGEQY